VTINTTPDHGACAMTGDGIFESMKEMADMIMEHKKHKGY
jgi:hypothetical protein